MIPARAPPAGRERRTRSLRAAAARGAGGSRARALTLTQHKRLDNITKIAQKWLNTIP